MGVRDLPTEFARGRSQSVTPEARAKVANTWGAITLTQSGAMRCIISVWNIRATNAKGG